MEYLQSRRRRLTCCWLLKQAECISTVASQLSSFAANINANARPILMAMAFVFTYLSGPLKVLSLWALTTTAMDGKNFEREQRLPVACH